MKAKSSRDNPYQDIIHLKRPVSTKHPPMSLYQRAAQFSSFSVLAGYDEKIDQARQVKKERMVLAETAYEEINQKLTALQAALKERPQVLPTISLTYFHPDGDGEGGTYLTDQGRLKKLDGYHRKIMMEDGRLIAMDEIVEISWQA